MNLSLCKNNFRKDIEELRKELNKIRESGILEENFSEKLKKMERLEKDLLENLIPQYRKLPNYLDKDKISIRKLKEIGSSVIEGFIERYLKITNNLYIISTDKRKIQFIYINKNLEVETSLPIDIKDNVSYFYKIKSDEILLITLRGKTYKILIKNLDKLQNTKDDIEIVEVKNDFSKNYIERIILLEKNIFLVEDSETKLNLVKLNSEINCFKNISLDIKNWTNFERIKDNEFLLSDDKGYLYRIKLDNNKFQILEKKELNFNIRKIKLLEDEALENNKFAILGDKGNLVVIEINSKIQILENFNNLIGNLFEIDSKVGTAIILSEDGVLYLLEENLNKWHLTKNYKKDLFYTNIIGINSKNYIGIDLDQKFNLICIDRIITSEDLWKVDLI